MPVRIEGRNQQQPGQRAAAEPAQGRDTVLSVFFRQVLVYKGQIKGRALRLGRPGRIQRRRGGIHGMRRHVQAVQQAFQHAPGRCRARGQRDASAAQFRRGR